MYQSPFSQTAIYYIDPMYMSENTIPPGRDLDDIINLNLPSTRIVVHKFLSIGNSRSP